MAAGPLKLVSRKFLPHVAPPKRLKQSKPLRKRWLGPTVALNGNVKPSFTPMLEALAGVKHEPLQKFRNLLKLKDFDSAEGTWQAALTAPTSSPQILSWKELAELSPTGSYGPPVLTNAINDIVGLHKENPDVALRLLSPRKSPLDTFILAMSVEKMGRANLELALDVLKNPDLSDATRRLGLYSLFHAVEMDVTRVVRVLNNVPLPPRFRLLPYHEERLSRQSDKIEAAEVFKLLVKGGAILDSHGMDKFVRRLYTQSDIGASVVLEYSSVAQLSSKIYPFIVCRLAERISAASPGSVEHSLAVSQIDKVFEGPLLQLSTHEPSIVLHLLVLRTIATDSIAAAAPVLDRWIASDERGISEPTWLLLFQYFRRFGRPDKCSEVLERALNATNEQLSLPFVGEYLSYVAQYYNPHIYITALQNLIPEAVMVLENTGIHSHVASLPPPTEPPLQPLRRKLDPRNRAFRVNRMHESWLVITYEAILPTVASVEGIVGLWESYVKYAQYSGSPTTLRVTSTFVARLVTMGHTGIGAAEQVFRDALSKIKLRHPVDGKNHSKALGTLVHKLVRAGDVERALALSNTALQARGVSARATALKPLLEAVPESARFPLIEWAQSHGVDLLETSPLPSTSQAFSASRVSSSLTSSSNEDEWAPVDPEFPEF